MELTRRRLLAAVGTAGVGGAYWLTRSDGDGCAPRRSPSWQVSGERWTRPVVGPHGVLVGENSGMTGGDRLNRVGCFRADRPQWVHQYADDGVGVPYTDEDLAAVGTGSDRVHAFEQPSGRHRWTYDAGGREEYGGGAWGQPARADGAVVVAVSHSGLSDADPSNPGSYTHRLLALDDVDGRPRWECALDAQTFVGPVVNEDTVAAVTESGSVYGVALGSGERQWRESLPGDGWVPPLLDADRGTVTVATGGIGEDPGAGAVAQFDAATGERAWTRRLSAGARGATRHEGRVVVTTSDGRALALDAESGDRLWKTDLGPAGGPVAASDATVAILDNTGVVHLLWAESGQHRSRFRTVDDRGDYCGWRSSLTKAGGVHLNTHDLVASGAWWLRGYSVDATTD
jgi:outer membrane protein assembly factor BamB